MPPRRTAKAAAAKKSASVSPPAPFKTPPDSLKPFFNELSPRHVYIAHIDTRPRSFKQKIFAVPVLMNLIVVLLFVWRVWYIAPYYWQLLETTLGTSNAETRVARDMEWRPLAMLVLHRGFTFMVDLSLGIFVWPWPIEFCFGTRHGNPVWWRWMVGFRDQEIYVRISRSWYNTATKGTGNDKENIDHITDPEARKLLLAYIDQATSSELLQRKTGYLLMNGEWDLDWEMMAWATILVDKKELAPEAFNKLVLLHHDVYGWLCLDRGQVSGSSGVSSAIEDERRKQVFAFRDALAGLGKEDLFFRWVEIIQFETSRPGGLSSPEKQAEVAKQVRDLFQAQGVNFDDLWRETVGSEGLAGF